MMAHVSIGRFQPTFFLFPSLVGIFLDIFLACLTKDRSTAAKGPPNNTWWARPSPATHPAVPAALAASAPAPLVPPAVPPRHRWWVAQQPLPSRTPRRRGRWYPPAWDLRHPGQPLNPPSTWMAASWICGLLWKVFFFNGFVQNGWSSISGNLLGIVCLFVAPLSENHMENLRYRHLPFAWKRPAILRFPMLLRLHHWTKCGWMRPRWWLRLLVPMLLSLSLRDL